VTGAGHTAGPLFVGVVVGVATGVPDADAPRDSVADGDDVPVGAGDVGTGDCDGVLLGVRELDVDAVLEPLKPGASDGVPARAKGREREGGAAGASGAT
jgi:hypothetical protein